VRQFFKPNLGVLRGVKHKNGVPPGGPNNLVQTNVIQTLCYIVSFNFLCWAVKKFHFRRAIGRAFSGSDFSEFEPQRTLKFGPNNCLLNNFLHYEFQLSMLSSSKILFWEGHFGGAGVCSSRRTPKFGPSNKNI